MKILCEDVQYLFDRLESSGMLPDDCFIANMVEDNEDCEHDAALPVEDLSWYGSDSGKLWEEAFIPDVVPLLLGAVEIMVTRESGLEAYSVESGHIHQFDPNNVEKTEQGDDNE